MWQISVAHGYIQPGTMHTHTHTPEHIERSRRNEIDFSHSETSIHDFIFSLIFIQKYLWQMHVLMAVFEELEQL